MREFRQRNTKRAERYWQVWLEDDFVCTSWGAIGPRGERLEYGTTKDRPGVKGKMGTASFVDSLSNAKFVMEREIRKRLENGYFEVDENGAPTTKRAVLNFIDWSRPLPKNLCFSKPRNRANWDYIKQLEKNNDLVFTRKVNGMSVIVYVQKNKTVCVYSRRIDDLTQKFPHIQQAIKDLDIPPRSILLFEAFMGEGKSKRDLIRCAEIMRSNTTRALALQKESPMKFYLYRVPFWNGRHLEDEMTNEEWLGFIEDMTDTFLDVRNHKSETFLKTVEVFEGSVDRALNILDEEGYEGWVCYQRRAHLTGYSYSFDGRPARPACAFKMKRVETDDFIAYWIPGISTPNRPLGTWGSGKNSGSVGTLSLYQLNANGEEVYIGECAGFSDEERERLRRIRDWPICVEVKYDSRFYKSQGDKTNSLDFPRYVRQREDKSCHECVNLEL